MSYIIILTILLIGYVISVIRVKRSLDEWLLPHKWFINLVRGLNVFWKALYGTIIPKRETIKTSDSKWANITDKMAGEALAYAKARMIEEGIVLDDMYLHRAFDCENFAQAMKHHVDVYLARTYGKKGLGFDTSVVGYTRSKGGGHAVLQICVDGARRWYNPYPNSTEFFGFDLSIDEIASIKPVVRG